MYQAMDEGLGFQIPQQDSHLAFSFEVFPRRSTMTVVRCVWPSRTRQAARAVHTADSVGFVPP